jgi:hypothetical protein
MLPPSERVKRLTTLVVTTRCHRAGDLYIFEIGLEIDNGVRETGEHLPGQKPVSHIL